MKFFQSDLLFFLASLLIISVSTNSADPSEECPSPAELDPNCICYSSVKYISCLDINTPFNLTKDYKLKSLYIINSPNLPLLGERFHQKNNSLHVDTLIIKQNKNSPAKVPSMDNMEQLFSLTTKAVKVVSSADSTEVLDVSDLAENLVSLSISNVRSLVGFDFGKFTSLKQIQLKNVRFQEPIDGVFFSKSSLTHIEITNTEALTGGFVFQPSECHAEQKIHIDLRNNQDLSYFDFTHLFDQANCTYHIDLSGNQKMRADLLTTQESSLLAQDVGRFYLVLVDVPLNCDCKSIELYHKHANYLHSVQCHGVKNLVYLEQIKKAGDVASVCPAPTTPTPVPTTPTPVPTTPTPVPTTPTKPITNPAVTPPKR